MSELLAVDIGHGFTKAVVPSAQPLVIPSVVGPAEAVRFESDLSQDGRGICLEVDGRSYFIGEQALLQSASTSQTLDPTRTGSVEQKTLFYAVASELVKTTTSVVTVLTGLPVGDFDDRNKALLRDMLRGEHTVRRQGKHTRTFTVKAVHILPQGVGSLYALVLDRRGQVRNIDLAGGRVGIVDVGTLTTNYILADRLRYVEAGSVSIPSGMSEFLVKVAKDLKREHGLDWTLQLSRVDEAVRARSVELFGETVKISDLVQPHLDALADTVISKARSLWGSGTELRAVVLSGGGSVELAPYFQRVYRHVRSGSDTPQLDNVTGYLLAGLRRYG